MAGWKGHLTFGFCVALVYLAFCAFSFVLAWWCSPLLFFAVIVGAFLPDLDSDSSVPVRVLFRLLCTAGALGSGYIISQTESDPVLYLLIGPLGAAILVHFVLFRLFKKITVHRGIFHSIPAILIASLSFLLLLRLAKLPSQAVVLLALGLGLGYFSHLLLDKMFGTFTLNGSVFRPRANSGGPLKWFSQHLFVNVLTYAILIALLYVNSAFLSTTAMALMALD